MSTPEYYYEMNELANELRMDWKINLKDPIDIFTLVQDKIENLTIVFTNLENTITGASIKTSKQNLIILNSKHSLGRQRFTLAHEIYHLKFDKEIFNICGIFENTEIEKKADNFATSLLMPNIALKQYKKENHIKKWNIDNIIKTEQYFQISHQTLLWRIKNLKEITSKEYEEFKNYPLEYVSSKGYDLKLYKPFSKKEFHTIGNYIKLTENLYKKELISKSKKEELLIDAYRSDLIYNKELLKNTLQ